MLNEVVLEGLVAKTWKYADDLLFHLACYRDPDLPSKQLNENQDASRISWVADRLDAHAVSPSGRL